MESREFAPKVLATYRAVIDLFREGADLNNLTVSEMQALERELPMNIFLIRKK